MRGGVWDDGRGFVMGVWLVVKVGRRDTVGRDRRVGRGGMGVTTNVGFEALKISFHR